jgi:hypothetical protein
MTVATVHAALLVAASFQSGWARRVLALEGMVFVAVGALASSLICSVFVLGKGTDSTSLLAFAVAGPAAGLLLVGFGVVRQLAPDLLQVWGPRAREQHVGEELARHDWAIKYAVNRRPFGYDLKAKRGKERPYILVKASVTFTTHTKLTPDQWKSHKNTATPTCSRSSTSLTAMSHKRGTSGTRQPRRRR